MSRENLDLVRRFYKCAERGDWTQLDFLADDVVYQPIPEVMEGGDRRGRDEFRQYMEAFYYSDLWAEIDTTPTSYREAGDKVIVRVEIAGRGRASALAATGRVFSVFTIRDGLIARLQDFVDREEALAAARE